MTKSQELGDYYDAFKCAQRGAPHKRSQAKDGAIPTHSVVPVPQLSEAAVLQECLEWLQKHNILVNRNNVGAGIMERDGGYYNYGIKNGGDIIGLRPDGIHLEIEVKRGRGGRLSAGQQQRWRDIEKNNGIYVVIHGVEELEYYRAYILGE